jgi:hypothetical protein
VERERDRERKVRFSSSFPSIISHISPHIFPSDLVFSLLSTGMEHEQPRLCMSLCVSLYWSLPDGGISPPRTWGGVKRDVRGERWEVWGEKCMWWGQYRQEGHMHLVLNLFLLLLPYVLLQWQVLKFLHVSTLV